MTDIMYAANESLTLKIIIFAERISTVSRRKEICFMATQKNKNIRYLNVSTTDEKWGITVTTAGHQCIPPHSSYPLSQHPKAYTFNPQNGRILNEYQLIYISQGNGYFQSDSCKKQKIKAGTMILLYPDEWHSYYPEEGGWYEHWVGFKGHYIEGLIDNKFFSKEKPIYEIGVNTTVISLFEDIVTYATEERTGYQQLISSMVLYIMGNVYYKEKNSSFGQPIAIEKIDEARAIMKKTIDSPLPIETIAQNLNVGYSWFRSMFKKYTGVSPAQYQLQLRYLRAKELLNTTQMSISDIAYALNFESVAQFSTFFRKKEGIPPLQFRKRGNPQQGNSNK